VMLTPTPMAAWPMSRTSCATRSAPALSRSATTWTPGRGKPLGICLADTVAACAGTGDDGDFAVESEVIECEGHKSFLLIVSTH